MASGGDLALGPVLGLYWVCTGFVLGLYWVCTGFVLGLCWVCMVDYLRLQSATRAIEELLGEVQLSETLQ